MLFLGSKAVVHVLWVKHQRPVPGIAISSVLASHGGARWTQPHAHGTGTLVVGEGGDLIVPDHSTITSMTTDPSEMHLLAYTSSLSLLVWDLSQTGFSRHVIYHEPPVQVRSEVSGWGCDKNVCQARKVKCVCIVVRLAAAGVDRSYSWSRNQIASRKCPPVSTLYSWQSQYSCNDDAFYCTN